MWRLVSSSILLILLLPALSAAQSPDPRDLALAVEATVRQALTRFAYNDGWALWGMACESERRRTHQDQFARAIDQGVYVLVAGQVPDLAIELQGTEYAIIQTTLAMEERRRRVSHQSRQTFHLQYDGGEQRWCISLAEFAGLTNYR